MPSDGASDDHGDDGDDHKMIKCSTWKRKREKSTIECVITFRIDSRTIKRRILWLSGYQVPLGVIVHAHAFRT